MPEGSEKKSIHFGSDLWAPEGTPVHASGRGKVVLAEKRIITGNTVILEHLPGVYTLYYHLDSINVKTGEIADSNYVIGTLGKSGFATGEHLHWEMRINGVPVDPMYFLEHPLLDISLLISNM
jgi:murein DD-endopeptidase MepM/ murein hydrolase activator NlpD